MWKHELVVCAIILLLLLLSCCVSSQDQFHREVTNPTGPSQVILRGGALNVNGDEGLQQVEERFVLADQPEQAALPLQAPQDDSPIPQNGDENNPFTNGEAGFGLRLTQGPASGTRQAQPAAPAPPTQLVHQFVQQQAPVQIDQPAPIVHETEITLPQLPAGQQYVDVYGRPIVLATDAPPVTAPPVQTTPAPPPPPPSLQQQILVDQYGRQLAQIQHQQHVIQQVVQDAAVIHQPAPIAVGVAPAAKIVHQAAAVAVAPAAAVVAEHAAIAVPVAAKKVLHTPVTLQTYAVPAVRKIKGLSIPYAKKIQVLAPAPVDIVYPPTVPAPAFVKSRHRTIISPVKVETPAVVHQEVHLAPAVQHIQEIHHAAVPAVQHVQEVHHAAVAPVVQQVQEVHHAITPAVQHVQVAPAVQHIQQLAVAPQVQHIQQVNSVAPAVQHLQQVHFAPAIQHLQQVAVPVAPAGVPQVQVAPAIHQELHAAAIPAVHHVPEVHHHATVLPTAINQHHYAPAFGVAPAVQVEHHTAAIHPAGQVLVQHPQSLAVAHPPQQHLVQVSQHPQIIGHHVPQQLVHVQQPVIAHHPPAVAVPVAPTAVVENHVIPAAAVAAVPATAVATAVSAVPSAAVVKTEVAPGIVKKEIVPAVTKVIEKTIVPEVTLIQQPILSKVLFQRHIFNVKHGSEPIIYQDLCTVYPYQKNLRACVLKKAALPELHHPDVRTVNVEHQQPHSDQSRVIPGFPIVAPAPPTSSPAVTVTKGLPQNIQDAIKRESARSKANAQQAAAATNAKNEDKTTSQPDTAESRDSSKQKKSRRSKGSRRSSSKPSTDKPFQLA